MGRVSTNKSSKSGFRTSTTGGGKVSGGRSAGGGGKGADPMPKDRVVRDAPVRWPSQGVNHTASYNRGTKMPVIKTAVVGQGYV